MAGNEEKIAVHENEIADIRSDMKTIVGDIKELIEGFHNHELDSVKYKSLLDEMIKEKESKRLARQAITDKLVSSSIWGAILLVATLAYKGFMAKVGGG